MIECYNHRLHTPSEGINQNQKCLDQMWQRKASNVPYFLLQLPWMLECDIYSRKETILFLVWKLQQIQIIVTIFQFFSKQTDFFPAENINYQEVLTAETIQGRKLFKGGNYLRKYGINFFLVTKRGWKSNSYRILQVFLIISIRNSIGKASGFFFCFLFTLSNPRTPYNFGIKIK